MFPRTVVALALLAACGSSSATTDATVKRDAADVFGCAGSAACTGDNVCCAMPGATTTFGCIGTSSCSAGDVIACDGPNGCGGSTPVCCGVDVPGGAGTFPQCGISAIGTSCTSAAACPTHIGTTCTDTTKVMLCHASADCTDGADNKCCTFTSGAASLTFCIDQQTAELAGATCH
jgi:hypothetical protein